jgi:hypothetical protein
MAPLPAHPMILVYANAHHDDRRVELAVEERVDNHGDGVTSTSCDLVLRLGRVEHRVDVEGSGDEERMPLERACEPLGWDAGEVRRRVVEAYPLAAQWRWPRPAGS